MTQLELGVADGASRENPETMTLAEKWLSVGEDAIDQQLILFHEAIKLIQELMILPGDDRFELVFAALAAGKGQKASMQAAGNYATGKTIYGDLLFGSDNRTDIEKHDDDESLFGYLSVFRDEVMNGSMKALTPEDPRMYANEVTQLKNTGPLNKVWDRETLMVNGRLVNLRNVAIYLTTNFADGNRVSSQDGSLRSRIAGEILTGDLTKEQSELLQSGISGERSISSFGPILPPAHIRASIHEAAVLRYPVDEPEAKALGAFVVEVIDRLNKTKLVGEIDRDDARIGEAFRQIAMVKMLKDKVEPGSKVDYRRYADVASIVLPTVVSLNPIGRGTLKKAKDGESATSFELAVASRRLIAHTAFAAYARKDNATRPEEVASIGVQDSSYASLNKIDFDLDKALFDDKAKGEPEEAEASEEGVRTDGKRRWRKSSRKAE